MTLQFGTDGVRGPAGTVLTEPVVRALGFAAAGHLGAETVVIGHDTRVSSVPLSLALAEGFLAGGIKVRLLGMVPTPAVAHVASADSVAGAIVSASHNSWGDNGVKLFAQGGRKLDDFLQANLQATWDATPELDIITGKVPLPRPDSRWENFLVGSVGERALEGLHLVVDCANGAMSIAAPSVLKDLGATVTVLNDSPDGYNINAGCGSVYPSEVQQTVLAIQADAGLAFDGDGDRVVAVSADGTLLDGDHLLGVSAVDLYERGLLVGDTVVLTVMANLGLRRALSSAGINVFETAVGDRYVLEALERNSWVLGGEQSGHLIFRNLATTGDGLLAAVQILDAARRRGYELGDWATGLVTKVPQVVRSVKVTEPGVHIVEAMEDEIDVARKTLSDEGRVLVRLSGTESVVRVMVETFDSDLAEHLVEKLCRLVEHLNVA